MSENKSTLAKLRVPFAPNQISKLPKPYKKESPKGNCKECGGYHGLPAAHLDYVGHAALTDRLLDTDPEWFWEPAAFGENGLPCFDASGGLWIRLTVCGVTRLGYGHANNKGGFGDAGTREKEVIGDALRNAAMRFGAALDLWHKGDLHAAANDEAAPAPAPVAEEEKPVVRLSDQEFTDFATRIRATSTKAAAKEVWKEATAVCVKINDLEAAEQLKSVHLDHARFVDGVEAKAKAEARVAA